MKDALGRFKAFANTFNGCMLWEKYANKVKKAYDNRAWYTEVMKKVLQRVMKEYGDLYNHSNDTGKEFKYYPEYFTIDHTWWATNEREKNKVNLYDWEIMAAIEHENDWMDWTYEVAKLDSIKASLKVVIGYMRNDLRDTELSLVEAQYRKLKNVSDDEAFGVILLNRDLTEGEDFIDMKCYLFTTEGVKVVN